MIRKVTTDGIECTFEFKKADAGIQVKLVRGRRYISPMATAVYEKSEFMLQYSQDTGEFHIADAGNQYHYVQKLSTWFNAVAWEMMNE